MKGTSELFDRLARIRQQAERLIHGAGAVPPEPLPPLESPIEGGRLRTLTRRFGLSSLAVDALLCLVAAEFDPFLRLLQRAVQRESGRPWLEIGTVAELLDLPLDMVPPLTQLFARDGILRRSGLVLADDAATHETPAVSLRIKVPERVARWLAGDDALPPHLRLLRSAPERLPPVDIEVAAQRLQRALDGAPAVIEIVGPAGCGRAQVASALAARVDRAILIADLEAVPVEKLENALAEAEREARLADAILCLAHWDAQRPASAPVGEGQPASPPRKLPPPLRRMLEELRGAIFFTAEEHDPLLEIAAPAVVRLEVPFPSPSQRAVHLVEGLDRRGVILDGDVDPVGVARRYALDPERLEAAARTAVELCGGSSVDAITLSEACRRQLRHDMASIAKRVTANHRWEDLVIPADVLEALEEMIAYARHGERVYDNWGFGRRHSLGGGLSALFAGPSGTGKTMCAAVMARELDMELFQVDLSSVLSKWIGETEKNLARVFDEAERSSAILLFDEADSLFAKRTEVKSSNDRYANLEVNFLLQRMEQFRGVTILTSNFEDGIDAAFKRRLTFRVRFEKPDADARGALWSKVFPSGCTVAADVDYAQLGRLYEMSGANIRDAALRAAFIAASRETAVTMEICMLAAERECREMGLLVRSRGPILVEEPPGAGPPSAPVTTPPRPTQRAAPRLVPVTHPR